MFSNPSFGDSCVSLHRYLDKLYYAAYRMLALYRYGFFRCLFIMFSSARDYKLFVIHTSIGQFRLRFLLLYKLTGVLCYTIIMPLRPRQPRNQACDRCHTKKTKCNGFPCISCQAHGVTCTKSALTSDNHDPNNDNYETKASVIDKTEWNGIRGIDLIGGKWLVIFCILRLRAFIFLIRN